MSEAFSLLAPAKINLSLEVVGQRPDGYHELVSVMQTVSLYDRLTFEPAAGLLVSSTDSRISGADNLVLRAAALLCDTYRVREGCQIRLAKRIPIAAGLGGGSSDAATALLGLNRLWNLSLPCEVLATLALQLGSDVPFFLHGGSALVTGRGEAIEPIRAPAHQSYLLVNPGFPVSTAHVFRALSREQWTDGSRTRQFARELGRGEILRPGTNDLQATLFRLYPRAKECFRAVLRLAPERTMISGSGPTVFAIMDTLQRSERAGRLLADQGYWVASVTNIERQPEDN